jgi:hypothetical protein
VLPCSTAALSTCLWMERRLLNLRREAWAHPTCGRSRKSSKRRLLHWERQVSHLFGHFDPKAGCLGVALNIPMASVALAALNASTAASGAAGRSCLGGGGGRASESGAATAAAAAGGSSATAAPGAASAALGGACACGGGGGGSGSGGSLWLLTRDCNCSPIAARCCFVSK